MKSHLNIPAFVRKLFILINSHAVHNELCGVTRTHTNFACAVPVSVGNTVFACNLTGKNEVFGIPTCTSGGKSAGFNTIDIENVFIFIPLKAVCVVFLIGIVAEPLAYTVTLMLCTVAV